MEIALLRGVHVALVGEGSCGKSSLMREILGTQFSRFPDVDVMQYALF